VAYATLSRMPILSADTLEFVSNSAEQTTRLGLRLGELLHPGDVICLSGDLGAGKTAFASGVGRGWGAKEAVNSPTYVFAHQHRHSADDRFLYHLDCYRLNDVEDAETIGIEDILSGESVVVIEWPERIEALLTLERLWVDLSPTDILTRRLIQFRAVGARYQTLLDDFRRSTFGG
jgi:tRNA threonylcarbamoyladenosine biosynthesis protein TsaE